MADEQFHGKSGTVKFSAQTLLTVDSWSINYTADTAVTTCLTATWVQRLPGFTDFEATVEAYVQSATQNYIGSMTVLSAIGKEATLSMTDGGGNTHTENYAICTSASFDCDMNGAEKLVLTFMAAGDD